jgi:hypothetical protein
LGLLHHMAVSCVVEVLEELGTSIIWVCGSEGPTAFISWIHSLSTHFKNEDGDLKSVLQRAH